MRGRLYELLTHCIPPDVVMRVSIGFLQWFPYVLPMGDSDVPAFFVVFFLWHVVFFKFYQRAFETIYYWMSIFYFGFTCHCSDMGAT